MPEVRERERKRQKEIEDDDALRIHLETMDQWKISSDCSNGSLIEDSSSS